MKNKTSLPELLSMVLKHKDLPSELRTDLWNFLNDRSSVDTDCPEYLALMINVPFVPETLSYAKSGVETENVALLISGLLNNPKVPEKVREALSDGIEHLYNAYVDQDEINAWYKSPEYVAMVLRGLEKAEAKDEQN